jgi:hypothetical protein
MTRQTGVVKIVSGGQTGVDRAALDTAIEHGIACGGWCPRGRLAEDGAIDLRYPLREAPSATYAERTALNVRDSDGTLVLTWGRPTNGTALTIHLAETMEKPCCVVDIRDGDGVQRAQQWLSAHGVRVLNVAGPRASVDPRIYPAAVAWLKAFLGDG